MYVLQLKNLFIRTYFFQNSLITTAHFIIWYLICSLSIFIGSPVILVDIQTGIIMTFLMLGMHTSRQSHS